MKNEEQIAATRAALHLLGKIPPGYRWALTVTDEDDKESPSVLNIYVPEADWKYVANKLQLKLSSDTGAEYESWRVSKTLLVSLLDEEKS